MIGLLCAMNLISSPLFIQNFQNISIIPQEAPPELLFRAKNQIGIGGEWVDLKLLLHSFLFNYMFIWCGLDGTDEGLERSQLNLHANVYGCCINNCQQLEKNPYAFRLVNGQTGTSI